MQQKLSTRHRELILDAIQVRVDTIYDDPDSADSFETLSSLETLEFKITENNLNFTALEKKWLIEEIDNKLNHIPTALNSMQDLRNIENLQKKLLQ